MAVTAKVEEERKHVIGGKAEVCYSPHSVFGIALTLPHFGCVGCVKKTRTSRPEI